MKTIIIILILVLLMAAIILAFAYGYEKGVNDITEEIDKGIKKLQEDKDL